MNIVFTAPYGTNVYGRFGNDIPRQLIEGDTARFTYEVNMCYGDLPQRLEEISNNLTDLLQTVRQMGGTTISGSVSEIIKYREECRILHDHFRKLSYLFEDLECTIRNRGTNCES